MKNFYEEIEKFYLKLKRHETFGLARFGDGEMMAIRGDTLVSGHGEWTTNGPTFEYSRARKALHDSFVYQNENYYVGIVCPCCQGMDNFNNMKRESGQADSQLTFANVFVNGNYPFFRDHIVPLFSEYNVALVANEVSKVNHLPFPGAFYPVKYNAWIENWDLIDRLKKESFDYPNGRLYLLACGPLGKILVHQLYENNPNHTYLDIGSTLHPWIESDRNIRGYYRGLESKTCVWGV